MKTRETARKTQATHHRRALFFSRNGPAGARPFFQAKLRIGTPGDRFEREADAVADRVVSRGTAPEVQRMCAGCAEEARQEGELRRQPLEEEEEPVQAKADPELRRQEPEEEEDAQAKSDAGWVASPAPELQARLRDAEAGGSRLPAPVLREMNAAFDHDFGGVRVHTDSPAVQLSHDLEAQAFTHGRDVYFSRGKFAPESTQGKRLLAHELTHVVQQGYAGPSRRQPFSSRGGPPSFFSGPVPAIQRDNGGSGVEARSPVVEETLTQVSDVAGILQGVPLGSRAIALARPIFGRSLDYSRVRLIYTRVAPFTTVGNNIRVPEDFSLRNQQHAQTLIHELTHVWQYQHQGTSYISLSLGPQMVASIGRGNRNFAYDYQLQEGMSFFDLQPEQQAFLVENYFAMLRDQATPCTDRTCRSNHLDQSTGFRRRLTWRQRQAEIHRELPLHRPLVHQMQAALPEPEIRIIQQRATELMGAQDPFRDLTPPERQLTPVRPLIEIRFPGL